MFLCFCIGVVVVDGVDVFFICVVVFCRFVLEFSRNWFDVIIFWFVFKFLVILVCLLDLVFVLILIGLNLLLLVLIMIMVWELVWMRDLVGISSLLVLFWELKWMLINMLGISCWFLFCSLMWIFRVCVVGLMFGRMVLILLVNVWLGNVEVVVVMGWFGLVMEVWFFGILVIIYIVERFVMWKSVILGVIVMLLWIFIFVMMLLIELEILSWGWIFLVVFVSWICFFVMFICCMCVSVVLCRLLWMFDFVWVMVRYFFWVVI